ncbi:RNA-guided endonuclease IscB, partial [Rhabdochromatium marinum]|uniref:RNA-guided endonuclease IscB n=1 Tax=Rhabdochromatium marinum TaxID=48729 RepID=UPI0019034630
NLRHRAPRFLNRTKPEGWLAPSLRHRLDTTLSWVARLQRLAPLTGIRQELVRFDTQALQTPEIRGVDYQQGELAGYQVREYLLEKWHRTCAYCGAQGVPLQIEHIHPKSRGGSDRVSNLTLACAPCNQRKGNQPLAVFLQDNPALLRRIQAQAKVPLRDAAAVNATRWALFERLKATGLPVASSSGARTKYNRQRFGIPKTHALDAACVSPLDALHGWNRPALAIKATGRGSYQRTRLNRFGFPRGYLMREKRIEGFQTGDRIVAQVPSGKKAGPHSGRVAVRASGSFNIQTAQGVVQGISHRYCRVVQRADGYSYSLQPTLTEEARQVA